MVGIFLSMLLTVFPGGADACPGDFETLHVERDEERGTWPFAASSGTLICERRGAVKTVRFAPGGGMSGGDVVLSTNPVRVAVAGILEPGVFDPALSPWRVADALRPWVASGEVLCDRSRVIKHRPCFR